jgi:nitroimidazol reductase NimA-like FMN-containing flavoprotein (pyridoxamine 5'-phosphate oxidase superfamily)
MKDEMDEQEPVTELDGRFSDAGAVPAQWAHARAELQAAPISWLSTVRPDGRPHVTPLLAIWRSGALYFCTGAAERKAANLARNPLCVLTTGCNRLNGLDLVVEGEAAQVSDEVERQGVADTYESKYGLDLTAPGGHLVRAR